MKEACSLDLQVLPADTVGWLERLWMEEVKYYETSELTNLQHNDPALGALAAEKKTLVSMFSIRNEDGHVCETKGMADSTHPDIRILKSRR